jgi:hypothetical protein
MRRATFDRAVGGDDCFFFVFRLVIKIGLTIGGEQALL